MLAGPTGVSLLLTRRAGAVQAASPLSCRDWGPPSQKAFDELPSPSPTGKCKGVRYMAATGGFLSRKPYVPSRKSQMALWGGLCLEEGVTGPSWQSPDLREPSAQSPRPLG